MLLTCSDQLHTPMANGCTATDAFLLFGEPSGVSRRVTRQDPAAYAARLARCLRARGGFDTTAQRAELAVVAVLVEGQDLLQLQLGDLLRPGPDHCLAGLVGLHRVLDGALGRVAEGLAQHH